MAIDAMQQTRRAGESKRLEAIVELVKEAKIPTKRLTIGRKSELIEEAVANATGLKAASSKKTFRSECDLVLDSDVLANFDRILILAEKVWNDRKERAHSKYHIVMKICTMIAGRRSHSYRQNFESVERHYTESGFLPT